MREDDRFLADLRECRISLRGGSRSFFAASLLLPARIGRPATALYAFCREADDLIDECGPDEAGPDEAGPDEVGADEGGPGRALGQLRERLDAVYAGRPLPFPADRALAHVVARHHLPRFLLDHLIEGFAWDAEGRRYEDLPALQDYAARVAGSVGAALAVLMGATDPDTVARACDLGIAMQLTNIARDVGEDARAGRLYLPLSWLREAGIEPGAFLAHPVPGPALSAVVARLLAEADILYRRADSGIAALPPSCRIGIGAARRLYAAIGREVARHGHDSVGRRATVSGRRKLLLAGRSVLAAPWPGRSSAAPPLPAVRCLVSAIAPAPRPAHGVAARVLWLLRLFGELDGRQAARGG